MCIYVILYAYIHTHKPGMYRLTDIYFTLDSNTIYCFLLSMKLSKNAYRL